MLKFKKNIKPLPDKTEGVKIECIEITEKLSFCLGNAVKYCWRHEFKNGTEDLEKAMWYIHRERDRVAKLSWFGRWLWRCQVQRAWNIHGKPWLVCKVLHAVLRENFARAAMEIAIEVCGVERKRTTA